MKSCLGWSALALILAASAAPAAQDCSQGPITDSPVHGTVNGQPFLPQKATMTFTKDGMVVDGVHLDRYALAIETDGIFNELTVDMMVPGGKKPDGRTFRVLPVDSIGAQPAAAPGTPEVQGWELQQENADVNTSFTQGIASIRVELGQRNGDQMAGKIHMCVPDAKAEIVGSFSATLQ